jgi:hypothetical protein
MEFLRFGSSIPGSYWGCCAVCIIQDFKQDPDEAYAIELVSGDGGEPIGSKFLGKTYREVFDMRMRIGTFSDQEMPNHAFLAVLTDWQISGTIGLKWLKILKEHGFEFIRTVDNSVYTGQSLKIDQIDEDDDDDDWYGEETHPNYIFGLFRNIGAGAVANPFEPPAAWTNLEGGVLELSDVVAAQTAFPFLNEDRDRVHLAKWQEGSTKFYKRAELEAENVPIWLAGRRSQNPQELAKTREKRNNETPKTSSLAPFKAVPATSVPQVVSSSDLDWY